MTEVPVNEFIGDSSIGALVFAGLWRLGTCVKEIADGIKQGRQDLARIEAMQKEHAVKQTGLLERILDAASRGRAPAE